LEQQIYASQENFTQPLVVMVETFRRYAMTLILVTYFLSYDIKEKSLKHCHVYSDSNFLGEKKIWIIQTQENLIIAGLV
jgi:hypothetical protein